MPTMQTNRSEKLLAAVQELRNHLRVFPTAQAGFENIRLYWLPSQLFPPDEALVHQALHVLINAGELVRTTRAGQVVYRANQVLPEERTDALPVGASQESTPYSV